MTFNASDFILIKKIYIFIYTYNSIFLISGSREIKICHLINCITLFYQISKIYEI